MAKRLLGIHIYAHGYSYIDHRVDFTKWWANEFKTIKLPSAGTVFDYYIDPETHKFEPWNKLVPKFEFDPEIPLQVSQSKREWLVLFSWQAVLEPYTVLQDSYLTSVGHSWPYIYLIKSTILNRIFAVIANYLAAVSMIKRQSFVAQSNNNFISSLPWWTRLKLQGRDTSWTYWLKRGAQSCWLVTPVRANLWWCRTNWTHCLRHSVLAMFHSTFTRRPKCCNECWRNLWRRRQDETMVHLAARDSYTLLMTWTCLRYS